MQLPFSEPKSKPRKQKTLLDLFLVLVSCLAYYSTLIMKVMCSSETSIDFHRTTRYYVPGTLHRRRNENPIFDETYYGKPRKFSIVLASNVAEFSTGQFSHIRSLLAP
jgi:hypothetical protein